MEINGLQWKVEVLDADDERLNDEKTYMGLCDFLDQTIYLRSGMSKKLTERTFIHELVHAIIFSYGINEQMDEDTICDFVASHYDEIQKIINEVRNGALYLWRGDLWN